MMSCHCTSTLEGESMNEKTMTLAELARLVDGVVVGDPDQVICGFAPLESAGKGDLSFLVKSAKVELLRESLASAFLVPLNLEGIAGIPIIRVKDPNLAGAIIHNAFLAAPFVATGVHERAFVGEDCRLDAEISIGPLAVVGDRVRIGRRVRIEAGAVIGDDVEIGEETVIKANAVISSGSLHRQQGDHPSRGGDRLRRLRLCHRCRRQAYQAAPGGYRADRR